MIKLVLYVIILVSFSLFVVFNSNQKVDIIFFFKVLEQVPFGVMMALSFCTGSLISLPVFISANISLMKKAATKIEKNNLIHQEKEDKLIQQLEEKSK